MSGGLQRMPYVRNDERRQPIPRFIRDLVHERDEWRCLRCGNCPWAANPDRRSDFLHADHVVPWSTGGSDFTNNLRTLCDDCNQKRSNFKDRDVTECHPTPIVRICAPCGWLVQEKPADSIVVYCGCRRHFSWAVDLSGML